MAGWNLSNRALSGSRLQRASDSRCDRHRRKECTRGIGQVPLLELLRISLCCKERNWTACRKIDSRDLKFVSVVALSQ